MRKPNATTFIFSETFLFLDYLHTYIVVSFCGFSCPLPVPGTLPLRVEAVSQGCRADELNPLESRLCCLTFPRLVGVWATALPDRCPQNIASISSRHQNCRSYTINAIQLNLSVIYRCCFYIFKGQNREIRCVSTMIWIALVEGARGGGRSDAPAPSPRLALAASGKVSVLLRVIAPDVYEPSRLAGF